MEQRKIQKVGRSTLSVSLPKNWVNQIGLDPGDLVYIERCRDSTLRLFSSKQLRAREAEIAKEYFLDCDQITETKLLERLIVGCYMMGFDVIQITSSDRITGTQISEIRRIVQRLVGANIIEMTRKEVVLQCFIDASKLNVSSLIQRLSSITSTMLTEALTAFLDMNTELASATIQREDEANSIYWLISRLLQSNHQSSTLNKDREEDPSINPMAFRVISKNLERIADCSKQIAIWSLHFNCIRDENNKNERSHLSKVTHLTQKIFNKAIDSLFLHNIIQANEALNLRDSLDAEVESHMHQALTPQYYDAIFLMLTMIAENSTSIAAIAINLEINKSSAFPN
jgi:phosphate uptake regulator